MKTPETARRRTGFTLVEILLALSILSVLLLLLLSAFTGAVRVREALSDRSREYRRIRLLLDRIGTDLEGAVATTAREDSALTCREDRFSGMPAATLVFTAFQLPQTDGGRPPSEVVKIRYFPRVGPGGSTVELRREVSDLPFLENRIPPREAVVAEGLKGFRVELWDGAAWRKEWPPSGQGKIPLPKKAAFTLLDSRGGTFRREVPLFLAGQEATALQSGRRSTDEK
ncbi:MAG: hypothetical protein OHK0028_18270 [Deltaproteobacteria bacterium]